MPLSKKYQRKIAARLKNYEALYRIAVRSMSSGTCKQCIPAALAEFSFDPVVLSTRFTRPNRLHAHRPYVGTETEYYAELVVVPPEGTGIAPYVHNTPSYSNPRDVARALLLLENTPYEALMEMQRLLKELP